MNIALDDKDFLAIFPMKGAGNVRLVGSMGGKLPVKAAFNGKT